MSTVPEAPNSQRVGGGAGSHGAVGRPASVRLQNANTQTPQKNRPWDPGLRVLTLFSDSLRRGNQGNKYANIQLANAKYWYAGAKRFFVIVKFRLNFANIQFAIL